METTILKICELMLDSISEFYECDSRARTFGTDTELYHSEIHMLQCIADNPELHISGVARLLGITRGAASQTAKRLERKQMISKEAGSIDNKRVVLHLTPKGETAYRSHKKGHEKYNTMIEGILADADASKLQFLTDFFLRFERALKTE